MIKTQTIGKLVANSTNGKTYRQSNGIYRFESDKRTTRIEYADELVKAIQNSQELGCDTIIFRENTLWRKATTLDNLDECYIVSTSNTFSHYPDEKLIHYYLQDELEKADIEIGGLLAKRFWCHETMMKEKQRRTKSC